MENQNTNIEMTRNSAPVHDIARHSLTIKQAAQIFADLRVARSNRSIQRFCEQEYLDCIRVKGAKGDQFFINRQSVERYAEELKQIAAAASIGDEIRDNVQQHDVARYSAPQRDTPSAQPKPPDDPDRIADVGEDPAELKRLRDENLNLRIDNRGKEQAINFLTTQLSTKDQHLQDLSYRLGAAETRVAQLEAPKPEDDTARQTATETETATAQAEAIIMPAPPEPNIESPAPRHEPHPAPRSFFGRLFG